MFDASQYDPSADDPFRQWVQNWQPGQPLAPVGEGAAALGVNPGPAQVVQPGVQQPGQGAQPAAAGPAADPFVEWVKNWRPAPLPPAPDNRPNTERFGYTPMKPASELATMAPQPPGTNNADEIDRLAREYIKEREGKLLGTTAVTNPILRGLYQSGLNLKQLAAIPLDAITGSDVSGEVIKEQQATERAAEILRGSPEGGGEKFVRNVTTGLADLLSLGGALKKIGLGTKTYLATVGLRSYDSGLAQADAAGLKGTERQTFAAANAAAEVGTEALFTKYGLGAMGKFFPGGLGTKQATGAAIKAGLGALLWQTAKTAGEESIEEGVTQFAQNANSLYHGVPITDDQGNRLSGMAALTNGVTDAMLTGGAVGGIVGGGTQIQNQRALQQARTAAGIGQVQNAYSPMNQLQNRLDQNAQPGIEAKQRQADASQRAQQFVAGLAPDVLPKVAELEDPSRSAFAKAAGIDRSQVPGRLEDRVMVAEAARQRIAAVQQQQQAAPPPAPPQPAGQSAPAQENQTTSGPGGLFGVQQTGPPGDPFADWQNKSTTTTGGPAGGSGGPGKTWDEGLPPIHRQYIDAAAKQYQVDPSVVRWQAERDMVQAQAEWELKNEIWQQFNLSKKSRGVLALTDEDKIKGQSGIGFDKLLQEFEGRHPNIDREFVKEVLKEKPQPAPVMSRAFVDQAASQAADLRGQLENQTVPPPPEGYASWDDVPFRPGQQQAQEIAGRPNSFQGPGATVPTGANQGPGTNTIPTTTMSSTGAPLTKLQDVAESFAKVGEVFSGKRGAHRSGRTVPGAAGQYNLRTGAIRIQDASDLTTLAHEVGHRISEATDVLANTTPAMRKELHKLGNSLYRGQPAVVGYEKEGYSEFVRMYLTDPADAKSAAPDFYQHFQQSVAANPAGAKAIATAQQLADQWFRGMGAAERVKAQIVQEHTLGAVWDKAVRAAKSFDWGTNLSDVANPLGNAEAETERITGQRPPESSHRAFLADRNTAAGVVDHFIYGFQFHPSNPSVEIGPSMEKILAPIKASGRYDDFRAFNYSLFGIESWKSGLNPGISRDDAAQTVREYDSPEFRKAADEIQTWNRNFNQLVSFYDPTMAEGYTAAELKYGFYLPAKRQMAAEELRGSRGGQGGAGGAKTGRISAERTGGGQPVKDQIAQLFIDKAMQLKRAQTRRVMERLLTNIYARHQVGGFSVPQAAYSHLIEETTGLPPDPSDFKWTTLNAKGQKTIRTFVIKPELRQVLEGLTPAQMEGALAAVFTIPAKLAKAGWIGLNPAYMVRNIMRDIHSLLIKAPVGVPAARRVQALAQYFHMMGLGWLGKSNAWMDFASAQGLRESLLLSERSGGAERVARSLGKGFDWKDPNTYLDAMFASYDAVKNKMQSPEFAARVAMQRMKAEQVGWKPGDPLNPNTAIELALAFKQPMGDYGAKGQLLRTWDQVLPLLSVPITYGRSFKQALFPKGVMGPSGLIAKRGSGGTVNRTAVGMGLASLTVSTLAMWLRNKDEEWYDELSPYDRFSRMYFAVPGANTGLTWMRNTEEGLVFSAIPEALLDAAYRAFKQEDDKPAMKSLVDLVQYAVDQALPSGPPALKEGFEQYANHQIGGGPIVPEREGISKRAPSEQFTDQTSETFKALGRGLGKIPGIGPAASPLRLEHAANSLTGGLSKRLTGSAEKLTGLKPSDRETQLSELPAVGAFFPSGGLTGNRPEPVDRLYRLAEELQQKQHSLASPETDAEKEKRLVVEAATRATSALLRLRSKAETVAEREQIMQRVSAIAKEAQAGSGDKQVYSGIQHAAAYLAEDDPAKRTTMLVNRLDDLTHAKPMLGQAGVNRGNLAERRQHYADRLEVARTFVREAELEPQAAYEAYRAELMKTVRSPEARIRRLRLVKRELGV